LRRQLSSRMRAFLLQPNDSSSLSKAGAVSVKAAMDGLAEIAGGAQHWRVWHLLGVNELRHRYARSRLGQFWVVLSTAIMIGTLASLWSLLWNQPLRDLMPFIGTGMVMWTYLSQVIIECTSIFVNHRYIYQNQKINFSVSIYSVIYKNTLMLAHSLIIILILIVIFGVPVNRYHFQIIPALLLTWITMVWAGYLIAMICVRYRDIIQLITNWMLVLFFFTPVMWKPDFLPSEYHFIIDYNPLSQFMEILRNPFLGEPVSSYAWLSTIVIACAGVLLALPLIGRYQRRVIFWM
jgi:homopolymeric O-antigen transport system permease protein